MAAVQSRLRNGKISTRQLDKVEGEALFKQLLKDVSVYFNQQNLLLVKRELVGLLDKESIERVQTGKALIDVLLKHGLLRPSKLALLRKISSQTGIKRITEIIDEFVIEKKRLSEQGVSQQKDFKTFQNMKDKYHSSIQELQYNYNALEVKIKEIEDKAKLLQEHIKQSKIRVFRLQESLAEKVDKFQSAGQDENTLLRAIRVHEEDENILQNTINNKREEINSFGKKKDNSKNRICVFDAVLGKEQVEVMRQELQVLEKEKELKEKDASYLKDKLEHAKTLRESIGDRMSEMKQKLALLMKDTIHLQKQYLDTMSFTNDYQDQLHDVNIQIIELKTDLNNMITEFESRKSGSETRDLVSGINADTAINQSRPEFKNQVLNDCNENCTDSKQIMPKVVNYESFTSTRSDIISHLQYEGRTLMFDELKSIRCHGDHLFILDTTRILKATLSGKQLVVSPIRLKSIEPVDFTIAADGRIFVVSKSILRALNSDGRHLWQTLPHIQGQKDVPTLTSISIDSDGNIYVLDSSNHQVQLFCSEGQFIDFVWGIQDLVSPNRIHITRNTIFVSDGGTNCLHYFKLDDKDLPISRFGQYGLFPCQFANPCGMTTDLRGNLFVADSDNHRVQIFNSKKEHITTLGMFGSSKGCYNYPLDVAVHDKGYIFVLDSKNNRIVAWACRETID